MLRRLRIPFVSASLPIHDFLNCSKYISFLAAFAILSVRINFERWMLFASTHDPISVCDWGAYFLHVESVFLRKLFDTLCFAQFENVSYSVFLEKV